MEKFFLVSFILILLVGSGICYALKCKTDKISEEIEQDDFSFSSRQEEE